MAEYKSAGKQIGDAILVVRHTTASCLATRSSRNELFLVQLDVVLCCVVLSWGSRPNVKMPSQPAGEMVGPDGSQLKHQQ